ncbi:heme-binding protein [Dechloromonas sp. XY25]|uniref:Heme-binding protein n=1 Tax=Dechloromonas hankyongensis TaxID=2908002 RepID=A0ABS9K7P5_9RHOO|nr:heme-binding protein [Dechloromonas hankyongensis]MCG2579194.1 heme-binding protein [Dechloromonas hankyongensis]
MDIEMIASLGLGSAEQLADRALAAAGEAGVRICVAVVDRAGYPLVFKRHPGAPFHSIEIALDKAYTVVSFGPATAKWDARLAKGSDMLRHGLMQRERFIGFGGGLPVKHEGVLVGAIGVSGGSEAQDVQFAEAALAGLAVGG